MSASGLMEYFDPLITWLKEQNKHENIGWSSDCVDPIVPTKPPMVTATSEGIKHDLSVSLVIIGYALQQLIS